MTESENPQAESLPGDRRWQAREDPSAAMAAEIPTGDPRLPETVAAQKPREPRELKQQLSKPRKWLIRLQKRREIKQVRQELELERLKLILQTQQAQERQRQEALRLWQQLQEEQGRQHSSSRSPGDVVPGDQDPSSLAVQAQRDAAFYHEVRRAVGRGAPTLLLGTSTKSLERSLAKLTAVHRKYEIEEKPM